METVQIASRRPTLLHLPPQVIVEKDAKGEDRPDTGDITTLQPGDKDAPRITEIPAAVWDRVQKHRVVKEWMRLGWIRIATSEDKSPSAAPLDLASLGTSSALAVVEVEESRAVLDGWLKGEDRQPIKTAIIARIGKLGAKK